MATNLFTKHSLSCNSLILVFLLTLIGILGGCGASSTAGPSHPTGSNPTSTPTKELKGTISEIPLPAHVSPGDITKGPDGNLWFTASATIGRITTTGTISEFPLPDPQSHPYGITTGSDGNLWFVGYIGNNDPKGMIWRITPTGKISAFPLTPGYYPYDITGGPDGNLWYPEADLDGWHDKIGRVTPTGTISEFPVPNFLSNLNGITAGPDGNIWFTEDTDNHSQNGKIGRITLTGSISEFPLPTPRGGPGAITGGPDGKIWFSERNSNKIGHLV